MRAAHQWQLVDGLQKKPSSSKPNSRRPSVGRRRGNATPKRKYGVGPAVCALPRPHREKNQQTTFSTKPVRFATGEQEGQRNASTRRRRTLHTQRATYRSAEPNVQPHVFALLLSPCNPCMVMLMQQTPKPPANRSLELTRSGRRPCPRCAEVHVASRGHGHLPPRAAQLRR